MKPGVQRGILGVAAHILAGCTSYTAKPIEPTTTAAALERRTLTDPLLALFITDVLPERVAAGTATWDVSTLSDGSAAAGDA